MLQLPIWAFPVKWENLMRPDWIKPGTRVLNQWRLGPALLNEEKLDPPIQSLFVFNSNPAIVVPEQDKIVRGLEREDLFTVVSEQFLTDTARYADIVLPATTQLEQFDIMFSWGHLYLSLNQKAIEPLGEAVPNTELFRRLARAMGFDDRQWQRSDEDMAMEALDWASPALQGITMDLLKEKGWARLNVGTADDYAPHTAGNFLTPSGKCEFKASMAAGGNFVLPLFRQGSNEFQAGEPVDPLPTYIPPRESPATNARLSAKYPLNVISPKSHAFLNSCYGNLPVQLHHAGEQFVLVNPKDAIARNIGEGSPVRVFNDRGSFEAIAKVSADVMPGVVIAPLGYWRELEPCESNGERPQLERLRGSRASADILGHAGRSGDLLLRRGGVTLRERRPPPTSPPPPPHARRERGCAPPAAWPSRLPGARPRRAGTSPDGRSRPSSAAPRQYRLWPWDRVRTAGFAANGARARAALRFSTDTQPFERVAVQWQRALDRREALAAIAMRRLAQRSLALRPAHSRRHLYVTCYTEGFSHFVTSMTAPVTSGWSVWPGGACTHWKAPPCHGAHVKRTLSRAIECRGSTFKREIRRRAAGRLSVRVRATPPYRRRPSA